MRHSTVLQYRDYLYLKLATLLCVGAVVAYVLAREPGEGPQLPFGGTWTGYALGSIGALLILWLLWFGVKKRRYRGATPVRGWLSAHIYLGLSLIVIATLHSGFRFGVNLHTFCYALMLIVIFSGLYGVYIYLSLPGAMSINLGDDSIETMLAEIVDLDREAARVGLQLPDEVNRQVVRSIERTRIGGGVWRQVSGRQRNDPTTKLVLMLEGSTARFTGQQATDARALYSLMVRKKNLVDRARSEIGYRARLQLWLVFHVPISIALVIALGAHIISVFYYR